MAIYEIARIQLRRGRVNSGTGVPQLASGELAWAIDAQELFIGNGAVAEGAPMVGNTRILTEKDLNQWGFFGEDGIVLEVMPWRTGTLYNKGSIVSNNIDEDGTTFLYTFLSIQEHVSDDFVTDFNEGKWVRTPYLHTYRKDQVATGLTFEEPVIRAIEDRLSDRVSLMDFLTISDINGDDATSALSRAVSNLFDNDDVASKAVNNPDYRVVLELPAGAYNVSNTISIPSYATIVGAGSKKTIINYTGTGPVFTAKSDSEPLTYISQPKHILLQGFSIVTQDTSREVLRFDSMRDSAVRDVDINCNWGLAYNSNNHAMILTAQAADVTCENNVFEEISIVNASNGIWSAHDIRNNVFDKVSITNSGRGIVFGVGTDQLTPGMQTGPSNNVITGCVFTGITKQAVYIELGLGNTVVNCNLINVGNDATGSLESTPRYPQIYFVSPENISRDNSSRRSQWLSLADTDSDFISDVSGSAASLTKFGNSVLYISEHATPQLLFRLPLRTNEFGTAEKVAEYTVKYNYASSTVDGYARKGILEIFANFADLSTPIHLTDTFDCSGVPPDQVTSLTFVVEFIDQEGEILVGLGEPAGVGVFYTNSLESDQGVLSYTYTAMF